MATRALAGGSGDAGGHKWRIRAATTAVTSARTRPALAYAASSPYGTAQPGRKALP